MASTRLESLEAEVQTLETRLENLSNSYRLMGEQGKLLLEELQLRGPEAASTSSGEAAAQDIAFERMQRYLKARGNLRDRSPQR